MGEKIIGTVFILNGDGDSERQIEVNIGQSEIVGGTYGSLVIDADKTPPLITAKGNVALADDDELVRTARLEPGETVQVKLTNGFPVGNLTYQTNHTNE